MIWLSFSPLLYSYLFLNFSHCVSAFFFPLYLFPTCFFPNETKQLSYKTRGAAPAVTHRHHNEVAVLKAEGRAAEAAREQMGHWLEEAKARASEQADLLARALPIARCHTIVVHPRQGPASGSGRGSPGDNAAPSGGGRGRGRRVTTGAVRD